MLLRETYKEIEKKERIQAVVGKKRYSHLTEHERVVIGILRKKDYSIREIATALKRNPSTISRELKRNKWEYFRSEYNAISAQRQYEKRMKTKGKMTRSTIWRQEVQEYIVKKLEAGWAPEVISGRMKLENDPHYVSHETIYQFIYHFRKDLTKYLKWYKRKVYKKRGVKINIPNRVLISERHSIINERKELGHWEADSVISGSNGKTALNVLIERTTRYVMITKLLNKQAETTKNAMIGRLLNLTEEQLKSITYDNGLENVLHDEINKIFGIRSYFCRPYASYEKGAVENVNNMIRKYLPKKMNFDMITEEEIKMIEYKINHTPRKILGYKTAYEVFYGVALST